jgi:hypothetical protein
MPQNCSHDSNTFLVDVQPAQKVNYFNRSRFSSRDGFLFVLELKNEVD